MPPGRRTKRVVVADARFPNAKKQIADRHEFHAEAIGPRLTGLRPQFFFETRGEKRLLLRNDGTGDSRGFVAGQSQIVRDGARSHVLDQKRRAAKLPGITENGRAAGRTRDLHAAVCKSEMHRVFSVALDAYSLALLRPAIELR